MARALIKTHSSSSIGSIKESMLSEADFQTQHGTGWVLMDGRSVVGSKYEAITGNSTIPDARGLFLRGKNNGRSDGNQNPDGELALGAYQHHQVQSHSHSLGMQFDAPNSRRAGGNAPVWEDTGGVDSTLATGGNETRPKNITVNYFIKINEA